MFIHFDSTLTVPNNHGARLLIFLKLSYHHALCILHDITVHENTYSYEYSTCLNINFKFFVSPTRLLGAHGYSAPWSMF